MFKTDVSLAEFDPEIAFAMEAERDGKKSTLN